MLLFVLAYLGGVLTILSPCILPVLPFVFARADQPFVRSGLPLLVGMAVTFAARRDAGRRRRRLGRQREPVRTLARARALARVRSRAALAGLRGSAEPPARRARRSAHDARQARAAVLGSSFLLGIATGLLWAPCAGPILGVDSHGRRAARRERRDVAAAARVRGGQRACRSRPRCCSAAACSRP